MKSSQIVILILSSFFSFACATTHYGKALPGCSNKKTHTPLKKGQTEEQVFLNYGAPEKTVVIGEKTYWSYKIVSGAYFLLLGHAKYRDVVVVFENKKVVEEYVFEKGRSVGILAYPSASN